VDLDVDVVLDLDPIFDGATRECQVHDQVPDEVALCVVLGSEVVALW